MLPPMGRLLMVVTMLGFAIVGAFLEGRENRFLAVASLATAIILAIGHFKTGYVFSAFQAYRRQDIAGVRKYLKATTHPDWLRPASKAYYDFLQGVVAAVDERFSEARSCFLRAVVGPLRTDHLKCATYCLLADVSLHLRETEEAERHLQLALSIPHRDELDPTIEELRAKLEP